MIVVIVVIVVQEQDDIKHLQADSDVCFCTRKRFIWSKKQLWLRIYRSDRYALHLGLRWSWAPLMPCLVGVYSFLWYICESTSSGLWSVVSGSSWSLAIKWALWIVCRMFSESLQPEHLCSLCTFAPFDDVYNCICRFWTFDMRLQAESKQKIIDKMVEVNMTCFLRTFDVNRVAPCMSAV